MISSARAGTDRGRAPQKAPAAIPAAPPSASPPATSTTSGGAVQRVAAQGLPRVAQAGVEVGDLLARGLPAAVAVRLVDELTEEGLQGAAGARGVDVERGV